MQVVAFIFFHQFLITDPQFTRLIFHPFCSVILFYFYLKRFFSGFIFILIYFKISPLNAQKLPPLFWNSIHPLQAKFSISDLHFLAFFSLLKTSAVYISSITILQSIKSHIWPPDLFFQSFLLLAFNLSVACD